MVDYTLLAKAALLHDIGKLCYRAGLTNEPETYPEYGARWLARLLPEDDEAMQQLLRCISYHRRRDFEAVKLKDDDLAYLVYFADTILPIRLHSAQKRPNAARMISLTLRCAWNRYLIIFRTTILINAIFCLKR